MTFCKNTHTDEHPYDISDQDWQKKVPCQPSARPGLEVGAALVRSGRRQAEPGGTHLYEKNKRKVTFPFLFSISYLDGEPLKTFLRLVDIRVRVQLGHVSS